MEQELVGIQIQIAGKIYPLKVTEAETEMVQKVADNINEKIDHLQKTYPRQDKQDYVSMAFFAYAVDAEKSLVGSPINAAPTTPSPTVVPTIAAATPSTTTDFSTDIAEKIKNINALLDKVLEA
jgi:bifunctional pyridoxal-dependent enzyme with beta-cystathionase and maltose regulon repressor activities